MGGNINRNIEVLSDFEYVLKRPEIFVGSTMETIEDSINISDGSINIIEKSVNIGLIKLFDEILMNAIDEVKRCKKQKKYKIIVILNEDENSITISDNGMGFKDGTKINPKSKLTNIETAYCNLRAGSNFNNDSITESLIGTNGVGGSLVNMLSSHFQVYSTNADSSFVGKWHNFKLTNKKILNKDGNTGTTVKFIPNNKIFGDSKLDLDMILPKMFFYQKSLNINTKLSNISLEFEHVINGKSKPIKLDDTIFHSGHKFISNDVFISITQKTNSSVLCVNSAICNGSPLRIIKDIINKTFNTELAEKYFSVICVINLPPNLVKFGDQNKTKYTIHRTKLEPILELILKKQMFQFNKSETFAAISKAIEDGEHRKAVDSLVRDKKKNNRVISKKYFQPSKVKKELFIVEGDSAAGPLIRSRNSETQGVYALKGKILNCAKASDIKSNEEIMDLVTILNLDFNTAQCSYERIIIATDADPDGYHICAQLINLFRWFKPVVDLGKLHIIKVPLFCVQTGSQKQYFYDLKDLHKYKNPIYLKGLGALMEEDWEKVMQNRQLSRVVFTEKSMSYIDMAFNEKSDVRKRWLTDKNCVK